MLEKTREIIDSVFFAIYMFCPASAVN